MASNQLQNSKWISLKTRKNKICSPERNSKKLAVKKADLDWPWLKSNLKSKRLLLKKSEKTNLRTKDSETSVSPTSRRNLPTETEEWKMAKEKQKIKKHHQSTKPKNGVNSSSTTLKNFLKDLSSKSGSKRMLQWVEVAWWAKKSIDYWSITPNILRFLKNIMQIIQRSTNSLVEVKIAMRYLNYWVKITSWGCHFSGSLDNLFVYGTTTNFNFQLF